MFTIIELMDEGSYDIHVVLNFLDACVREGVLLDEDKWTGPFS